LTASDDATARLWDPRTQPQLEVVARSRGPVAGATYAWADAIVIAGPGNRARIVSAADGRLLRSLFVAGPVRAVSSSADGGVIGLASASGITVFGPDEKRTRIGLPAASAVAVSSDGSAVAGGSTGGIVRVWSASGQLRHELAGHDDRITDAAFSHDGVRVATSSLDGTTRVWDVATGKPMLRIPGRKGVLSVAFSPDGRLVLTSGLDHTARLWDAETGRLVQVLRFHYGRVADANFSPDGRWIVTAGPATVGLWAPGVPEPILPYGFDSDPLVTSSSFDPTGRLLLSASTDGTVRRGECAVCTDLDELLELAGAQLESSGRELTAEERERYGLD
jgi:WD40 repeat protein